jgi:hypothetical protein
MSVLKPEGGPAESVKTGTEELREMKWDYHFVGMKA